MTIDVEQEYRVESAMNNSFGLGFVYNSRTREWWTKKYISPKLCTNRLFSQSKFVIHEITAYSVVADSWMTGKGVNLVPKGRNFVKKNTDSP